MATRALWAGAAVLLAALAGGCDDRPQPQAPSAPSAPLAEVSEAFDECLVGDLDVGLEQLDNVLDQASRDSDALVARGLCRWSRWSNTGDAGDIRGAYADLSDALQAASGGDRSGPALAQIYSHRAYVAQALDSAWVRALEDLDRAVALAPGEHTYLLDRAVARASAGQVDGARADLDRVVALPDTVLPDRQRVAQAMLDDLAPPEPEP